MKLNYQNYILGLVLCIPIFSTAQVGVNTTNPQAQLDITASNSITPSNTDGLLVPRVDNFPATNPTATQQGMLVYLTTTIGLNAPGFYYWNNITTTWIPIAQSALETDPQVSSVTPNRIPKWNGTTLVDGQIFDNGISIGIGTSTPTSKLEVNGTTKTTNFQMTNGANGNYILQTDAIGNASWVNPSTLSITETDPQVSSTTTNRVAKWTGFTLVDGIIMVLG
jgi:hypothetical protein